MKSKLLTLSLAASAVFAGLGMSPAMAQGVHTPNIDRAQQGVGLRIQQGLSTGQITPSEAQIFYRRDRDIEVRESYFKSNGNASPQERQDLRMQVDGLRADVERLIASRPVAVRPSGTPGIDNQSHALRQRIDEGIRSGRIDRQEARRLQNREREFERHEARVQADGVVTQQERRQLRNELASLRDDVERAIRNRRG
ncbi:MAG: hypothetical protein Q7T70_13025 [Polaromonas sp.]|nr:hypothetical protein [Polaromonas sp.]